MHGHQAKMQKQARVFKMHHLLDRTGNSFDPIAPAENPHLTVAILNSILQVKCFIFKET